MEAQYGQRMSDDAIVGGQIGRASARLGDNMPEDRNIARCRRDMHAGAHLGHSLI